jgi:hypothetical protein
MQVRVQAREPDQPLDDGLRTGDEQLALLSVTLLSGQVLVRPDKYRKATAVHEGKRGEIHHEELRELIKGAADGNPQLVLRGRVKFPLQAQY